MRRAALKVAPSRASRRARLAATPPRPSHAPTDQELADKLFTVRQEELLALYKLRLTCNVFIRQVEVMGAPFRALPDPQAVLSATSSSSSLAGQYICTHRHAVAAKTLESIKNLVKQARDIQEHCKDLEGEEPPALEHESDHAGPHDFVTLQLEERVRRQEIKNKMKIMQERVNHINKAADIARDESVGRAYQYLARFDLGFVPDTESSSAREVAVSSSSPAPPGRDTHAEPASSSKFKVTSGWDELQKEAGRQLKADAAPRKTTR